MSSRRGLMLAGLALPVAVGLVCLGNEGRAAAQAAAAPPDPPLDTLAWNRANGPRQELRDYDLVWSDEFDSRSIRPGDARGEAKWYAGAQGGPYGAAAVGFDPRSDVYLVSDGILTIRAHAYTDANGVRTGKWYSGHLQTVNRNGEGFAIQEGYFEARMKFPGSMGAWPAFWLKHRNKWLDPAATNMELDIVEWYGGDWHGHHHSAHIGQGKGRRFWSDYERVMENGRPVNLADDWHTYGAMVTRDWFIVYLDRVEIGRFPMVGLFRQPLYPQLTLSILKEKGLNAVHPAAVSPMDLQVDYVRVYAPRAAKGR